LDRSAEYKPFKVLKNAKKVNITEKKKSNSLSVDRTKLIHI